MPVQGPFTGLQPPPRGEDRRQWNIWFDRVYRILGGLPGIGWLTVDKTGSSLSDIVTRPHSALTNIEGSGTLHVSSTNTAYWDSKADGVHVHVESDVTNLVSDLAAKQETLVSGTNIKTVNGNSLLGSGNITISGSGTGDMVAATYDPAGIAQQLVGTTATQTLTNKTLNDYVGSYVDADALHLKVMNNSGGVLTIGTPVYNDQWNSTNSAPEVIKAIANSSTTCPCHGLVEEASIADGAVGSVRNAGILNNVNTSTWSSGVDLWLSPTTAGTLTSTMPTTAGQYRQFIGTVIRQHATLGVILVQIGPAELITAAGATITGQYQADFATPMSDSTFTVTDANVSATSVITVSPAYEDTIENTADEVAASGIICSAGKPSAGSFTLHVASQNELLYGKYLFNYIVG